MTVDRSRVERWLDAYVDAWKSYDTSTIADLFTHDAEYRWHPWDAGDDVARGREQIVAGWLSEDARDPEGTYDAHYEPVAVDGSVAVAVGTSSYYTDSTRSKLDRMYHNCFLLEFDDEGQCRRFTEWFMQTPPGQLSREA